MVSPPGLGRRLRGLADPLVTAAATVPGADQYRKTFTARDHLWILLDHVLAGGDSLRQTHTRLEAGGWRDWGSPTGSASASSPARAAPAPPTRPRTCSPPW